jgi:hypothetical protein
MESIMTQFPDATNSEWLDDEPERPKSLTIDIFDIRHTDRIRIHQLDPYAYLDPVAEINHIYEWHRGKCFFASLRANGSYNRSEVCSDYDKAIAELKTIIEKFIKKQEGYRDKLRNRIEL